MTSAAPIQSIRVDADPTRVLSLLSMRQPHEHIS